MLVEVEVRLFIPVDNRPQHVGNPLHVLAPHFLSLGSVCLGALVCWNVAKGSLYSSERFYYPTSLLSTLLLKMWSFSVCRSYIGSGWYVFLLVAFQFQLELIQEIYSWANVLPLVLRQNFWTSVKLSLFLIIHHVLAIFPLAPPWS